MFIVFESGIFGEKFEFLKCSFLLVLLAILTKFRTNKSLNALYQFDYSNCQSFRKMHKTADKLCSKAPVISSKVIRVDGLSNLPVSLKHDMKIVLLVRDPRGMVNSRLSKGWNLKNIKNCKAGKNCISGFLKTMNVCNTWEEYRVVCRNLPEMCRNVPKMAENG